MDSVSSSKSTQKSIDKEEGFAQQISFISCIFVNDFLTPGNDRGVTPDSIDQSNQIWFSHFSVHQT